MLDGPAPRAPSTSSSAPTGCSPATSGSRTSGWSSSTRSSASASSTRSSSSSCGPTSTCWRCRRRRSRARWRWRSPASARCRRIATPPEERHPVLTFVGAYEEKQIAAAIRRELLREGQVFYVHNRVESIERTAARLRELVPEARIATAHGQMGEHRLEQVIVDFWEKRFDVLVCTTIVETGLDISNANTLIVERADLLGLSQLHQLRGRVGRGRERAYAYFLYPPEKPMTETAHDRLATIAAAHRPRRRHADRDEGPGDPRRRQPARRRAVRPHRRRRLRPLHPAGRRGGRGVPRRAAPQEPAEIRVELPVDAHLPHDYVPGERLRLEAYRQDRRGRPTRRAIQAVRRGAAGPVRAAARAGGEPAGRRPVPAHGPRGPGSPRSPRRATIRFAPVRAARLGAAAAQAALPGRDRQAGRPHHAGAPADDGAGRRHRCGTWTSCAGPRTSSSRCWAAGRGGRCRRRGGPLTRLAE